jgi:hypothetical protein
VDDSDDVDQTQLSDRFNNTNLKLRIDGDNDGFVDPDISGTSPTPPENPIRTNVTAWVEGSDDVPSYALWD